MEGLISLDDQLYLLAFWCRNNVVDIVNELASLEPDFDKIRTSVESEMDIEYGITEPSVINEIMELIGGHYYETI